MGAGKTTAIQAISDIPPVTTEAKNTDKLTANKDTTTVAMEYGEVALGNDTKLALYGMPGQSHFDFLWPIVGNGALGGVLLIDCSRADWETGLRYYLKQFATLSGAGALVIGLNRFSNSDQVSESVMQVLQELDLILPFYFIDPRQKSDVYELLEGLLVSAEIEQKLYGDQC